MLAKMYQDRIRNTDTVFEKAHLTTLNIGFRVKPIQTHILQPLIEGASLQDEPTLQDLWAKLIANAGNTEDI